MGITRATVASAVPVAEPQYGVTPPVVGLSGGERRLPDQRSSADTAGTAGVASTCSSVAFSIACCMTVYAVGTGLVGWALVRS